MFSAITYSEAISAIVRAAKERKDINAAARIYNNCLSLNRVVNPGLHNAMITAAGICNRFDLAIQAYNNAVNSKVADVVTCNAFIRTASACNKLDENLIAIYKQAAKTGIANTRTYSTLMNAARQHHRFDLMKMAYFDAVAAHKANERLACDMITQAGLHGDTDLTQNAYKLALEPHAMKTTAYIHNSMISATGHTGHFDLVMMAYNNAVISKVADVVTHNALIKAAGQCKRLDKALQAYNNAVQSGTADSQTFSTMMITADACGDFTLVVQVYNDATTSNHLNHFITDIFQDIATHQTARSAKAATERTKKPALSQHQVLKTLQQQPPVEAKVTPAPTRPTHRRHSDPGLYTDNERHRMLGDLPETGHYRSMDGKTGNTRAYCEFGYGFSKHLHEAATNLQEASRPPQKNSSPGNRR